MHLFSECFLFLIISSRYTWAKWDHDEHDSEPEPEYDYYVPKYSMGYSRVPNGVHLSTWSTIRPDYSTTTTRSTTRWSSPSPTPTRPPTVWPTQTPTVPTTAWPTPTRPQTAWPTPTATRTSTTRPTQTPTRPTTGWPTRPSTKPPTNWPTQPQTSPPITKLRSTRPIIGQPEPEPIYEYKADEYEDMPSTIKTCQMTCRSTKQTIRRDWKTEKFWSVITKGYSCRLQETGKKMLGDKRFCDLFINSVDPDTNRTESYCAHSSVLSLASDRLRSDVTDAVRRHERETDRNRERLPSYDWPPLPMTVIESLLQYIYTFRITSFDDHQNIIGLYVGAFVADLTELMEMVEEFLYESFDVVEQLNQFVAYFRWAHITNNVSLKANLKRIGRNILKMDQDQFDKFIENICESSGYNLKLN